MKKMRKLLAVVLAITTMLAMSITTFAAATSAKVTIQNLGENAKVTYTQIIKADTKKANGWAFTADGANFVAKLKEETAMASLTDEQLLDELIKYKAGDKTSKITASIFENAVEAVAPTNAATVTGTTADFTANEAGVYAIKAVDNNTPSKYAYSPMAAYVAFGDYNTETGVPSKLENVTINAKKTTNDITKTDTTDKVVAVGSIVPYKIEGAVPYIKESVADDDVVYKITDTITGAKYKENDNHKVVVTINVDGKTPATQEVEVKKNAEGKDTITIDLKEYAKDRDNANKSVLITYDAEVTGIKVGNTAVPTIGKNDYGPVTDEVYTGTLTLTKTGDANAKLNGAGFKLYSGTGNDTKWAVASEVEAGKYNVTAWTTTEKDGTEMFTAGQGTLAVAGLDDSVEYSFKEITAPEGYSVNTTDAKATWTDAGNKTTAENRTGTAAMTDTKLNSLPETGGIGTTMFTVGGIVVMIAAAGLYFASRKKRA